MQTRSIPMWLLLLLIGLPLIGETIYSPSLPQLAADLNCSSHLAEATLSIYLLGFAFGVAGWGLIADRYGRRPAMLGGLLLYTLSSFGCMLSGHIYTLLGLRLLQALGGSAGSVVGQTLARDLYQGEERGRAFATISMAVSAAPAIGTFLGGLLVANFGWVACFGFLFLTGLAVLLYSIVRLSETRPEGTPVRALADLLRLMPRMLRDPHILTCAGIIALCNGIFFSFYAEGPFVIIELIGLEEQSYGMVGLAIAVAGVLAAYVAKRLAGIYEASALIRAGALIILLGACLMLINALKGCLAAEHGVMGVVAVLLPMGLIGAGNALVIPNILSIALKDYAAVLGTAGAVLGLLYYMAISGLTAIMSLLHDGSALPLPLWLGVQALCIVLLSLRTLSSQVEERVVR